MKKFLVLLGAVLFLGAVQAQTTPPKPPTSKSDMSTITPDLNTKDHVCTAACKDERHVYVHGERGHRCGAECMKAMSKTKKGSKTTLKEHVCTADCTKEKHAYAHGEKGHTCSAACHTAPPPTPSKSTETLKPPKKS